MLPAVTLVNIRPCGVLVIYLFILYFIGGGKEEERIAIIFRPVREVKCLKDFVIGCGKGFFPDCKGSEWAVQEHRPGSVGNPASCRRRGGDRDVPDPSPRRPPQGTTSAAFPWLGLGRKGLGSAPPPSPCTQPPSLACASTVIPECCPGIWGLKTRYPYFI